MDLLLENFSWRALWTPELIVILLLFVCGYFLLVTKWRYRFQDAEPVKLRKKIYFTSGLLALYLAGAALFI